tara:strand:- start:83 stop:712 length:630 start_codon:yes stop_codon:yes gene_type:complete
MPYALTASVYTDGEEEKVMLKTDKQLYDFLTVMYRKGYDGNLITEGFDHLGDQKDELKEKYEELHKSFDEKRKIVKLFSNRLKEFKEENTQLKEYITDLEEAGSSSDSEKSSDDTFILAKKVERLENELKLEGKRKNHAIDMAEEAIIENKAHIIENARLQYHLKELQKIDIENPEDVVEGSEMELGMDEEGNFRIFESEKVGSWDVKH